MAPGVQIELTPDEAEALGAFEETALSEADAWEANTDVDMKEAQNAL
jgi:type IV secretion system protein VirB1